MNIQMSCKASFQDNCESNLEEKEIETSLSNKSTSLDFSYNESELECDGYLTPFNSLESLSVDEAETPKITDEIIDKIISFFKVKRPVRFIDKETKEDEVTYEESEIRLIILMILSAIILTLVNTSIATFTTLSMFNKETLKNPWDPIVSNSAKGSFPTFNIIVIDRNGNMESLQLQNQNTLKESYKMKLPKTDKDKMQMFNFILEGYFPFEEKGDVYIVRSKGRTTDNGKKLITKISSNGHHRVIKSNELPIRFTFIDTTSFRLGKLFWLVGQPDMATSNIIANPNFLESWIFSIEKHTWFKGPFYFEWVEPCGVPLNRTSGLILYKTLEPSLCFGYHLFNFDETFAFTNNNCFLDILDVMLSNRPPSCTSMVEKNGSIKVFYGISCQYNHGEIFKLYEIDVAKMEWKEINGPELIEGQVTSIKGQLYIFSICNNDNPPCKNMNSAFFLNVKSDWQEFKKEGNVTDIVTIFPYQA